MIWQTLFQKLRCLGIISPLPIASCVCGGMPLKSRRMLFVIMFIWEYTHTHTHTHTCFGCTGPSEVCAGALLRHTGPSLVVALELQCAQAQSLWLSMMDLVAQSGIKPTSPALEGGFLTTLITGNSVSVFVFLEFWNENVISMWKLTFYPVIS